MHFTLLQYEVPLSRMLHDILDDDHLQRHPPLIRHYTNFWPYYWSWPYNRIWLYLIARGFHRTFATGAACQQRTLTPPDTWSCPPLGLASVLMLRPMSPELVLFLDFWVSNIPRYFCFCFYYVAHVLRCLAYSLVCSIHFFSICIFCSGQKCCRFWIHS